MVYVFDTSSFSVIGNYFPQSFPSFWTNFDDYVGSGEIISVREVYNELDGPNIKPHLTDWISNNRNIFLTPENQETEFVADIFSVAHFQNNVSRRSQLRGSPVADPFIVAAAKVRDGCVITEETLRPNAAGIPNICGHFNVEYKSVENFLESLGWRF